MKRSGNSCEKKLRFEKQKGISLFVVISALLILSVLTISITAQLMAPTFAGTNATQHLVRENYLRSALQILRPIVRRASLARVSNDTNLPNLDGTLFEINIDGRTQRFVLQDINGLIDVNSASPKLLSAFLLGLNQELQIEPILRRRAARPFKSIEAFTALLPSTNISALLTIHSGRRRINSQTAPLKLLSILAGRRGTRIQLVPQIERRFFHVRPVTEIILTREDSFQQTELIGQ